MTHFQPMHNERDYMDLQRIQAEDAARPQPTPEQIREYLEAESKTAGERLQEERENEICRDWILQRPEYAPSKQNASMVQEYLDARGLRPTHETLDQAFNYLADKEFITHNRGKVAASVQKQIRQSETTRRANAIIEEQRRNQFTEEQLRAMPLEQLRHLAITGRGW